MIFTFICNLDIAIWKWSNFDKIFENFDQKMLTSVIFFENSVENSKFLALLVQILT